VPGGGRIELLVNVDSEDVATLWAAAAHHHLLTHRQQHAIHTIQSTSSSSGGGVSAGGASMQEDDPWDLEVIPVLSHDVHEIRAYNRLARLARGEVLVLLQVSQ
jgi:hypothetical protein